MLPPRPLLAVCLLLLGGLGWSLDGREPPTVDLADAALWEGQAVRVEGWAQDVRRDAGGTTRLVLTEGAAALAMRVLGDLPLAAGERVQAAGRLVRSGGSLTLMADDADAVRRVAGPEPAQPGWTELGADPGRWHGHRLLLSGTIERGLLSGDGATLALGLGPWPRHGRVEAIGLLRYDASCLCHRFDASEVRPWTA